MDLEGKAPLIIVGIIGLFIIVISATIVLASVPDAPQAPTTTPWPTLMVTPPPTTINQSTSIIENDTGTDDDAGTIDDHSFEAYQDLANNALKNQTPNEYKTNLTGNNYVDYTRLAEMYPWVPNRYNDSSEYPWMWTPEKFAIEYNGQGDAQRVIMYNAWKDRQVVKAPEIVLDILHNDDKTPYDFNTEAIILGHNYDGYFRFTNIGEKAFQGNIAVAINASLFFAGQLVHLENKIITNVYLSLYPGQSNDFYEKWTIDSYGGAPIPTGALNIVIEIRDLSDGTTISSKTIKPIVARDPNGDGILTF